MMLDEQTIRDCSMDEFVVIYEDVKSLVEDQSHLQGLVNAVNSKIESMPEAFRPEALSFKTWTERVVTKTWRLGKNEKMGLAYVAVSCIDSAEFVFADVFEQASNIRLGLNILRDELLNASKSSVSDGLSMLEEKKWIKKTVPETEDGVKIYGQTTYKRLPAFAKNVDNVDKEIVGGIESRTDIWERINYKFDGTDQKEAEMP